MRDERGPWYLFTGLVVGIAFGLVYAWIISPVRYIDTIPSSLRADFKDQYRVLIAVAYLSNGDLDRAKARLNLLKDENPAQSLAIQAQLAQSSGASESELRGLSLLASALDTNILLPTPSSATPTLLQIEPSVTLTPTPVVVLTETLGATDASSAVITSTQATSLITITPKPTVTPLPTLTASPTPGAPFILQDQSLICDPKPIQPLIEVQAFDAASQPVPGVELVVTWDSGQDRFFTGLKPEISPGYADFTMTPGTVYTLQFADGGNAIPDLTPAECEAQDGSRYWGSWRLTFIQP